MKNRFKIFTYSIYQLNYTNIYIIVYIVNYIKYLNIYRIIFFNRFIFRHVYFILYRSILF